jgi:hypothetical protein
MPSASAIHTMVYVCVRDPLRRHTLRLGEFLSDIARKVLEEVASHPPLSLIPCLYRPHHTRVQPLSDFRPQIRLDFS